MSKSKPRILLADDSRTSQMLLGSMLEAAGFDITAVGDGRQALDAWRSGSYDLVLMDIQMPVMDGLGAVREIRIVEAREERPRTPVIALSGDANPRDRAECLAAGMNDFVAKPIDPSALLAAMDRIADIEAGAA